MHGSLAKTPMRSKNKLDACCSGFMDDEGLRGSTVKFACSAQGSVRDSRDLIG